MGADNDIFVGVLALDLPQHVAHLDTFEPVGQHADNSPDPLLCHIGYSVELRPKIGEFRRHLRIERLEIRIPRQWHDTGLLEPAGYQFSGGDTARSARATSFEAVGGKGFDVEPRTLHGDAVQPDFIRRGRRRRHNAVPASGHRKQRQGKQRDQGRTTTDLDAPDFSQYLFFVLQKFLSYLIIK